MLVVLIGLFCWSDMLVVLIGLLYWSLYVGRSYWSA